MLTVAESVAASAGKVAPAHLVKPAVVQESQQREMMKGETSPCSSGERYWVCLPPIKARFATQQLRSNITPCGLLSCFPFVCLRLRSDLTPATYSAVGTRKLFQSKGTILSIPLCIIEYMKQSTASVALSGVLPVVAVGVL